MEVVCPALPALETLPFAQDRDAAWHMLLAPGKVAVSDAGVVYLPKRKPYVLVILTEWDPEGTGRSRTIAAISHTIYEFLTQGPPDE